MTRRVRYLAFALLLVVAATLHDRAALSARPGSGEGRAASGLARGIGETVASLLFLRVDYYHHSSPDRGLLNREIVPLLRVIVALDPAFVRAWSLLAFEVGTMLRRPAEGREILLAGIAANPADPLVAELWGDLGILDLVERRDTDSARLALSQALLRWTPACDPDDHALHALYLRRIAGSAEVALLGPRGCPCGEDHGAAGPASAPPADGTVTVGGHRFGEERDEEDERPDWARPEAAAGLRRRAAGLAGAALVLALLLAISPASRSAATSSS